MTTITQEILENPKILYRHTVDEYHQMLAHGTLEDGAPFELLDGQVVHKIRGGAEDPITINPQHATVVSRLADLNPKLKPLGCYLRTQSPVSLPPWNEPEPDGAIVRGTSEDYAEQHPGATDVLCVIEAADASLRRNRGYKQSIYANSAIARYIILNLIDRVAEVYTEPMVGKGRYGQASTLTPKQTLVLPTAAGKTVHVPLKRLLGPGGGKKRRVQRPVP